MGLVVFLGNGMRAYHYFQTVLSGNEVTEVLDVGTGWISYNHARRKMNDLCSILLHLFRSRFHVSAGAAVTCGKSHELDLIVLVYAERSLPSLKSAETFTTGACMVAMTNDDSDPGFLAHDIVLSLLVVHSLHAQPASI